MVRRKPPTGDGTPGNGTGGAMAARKQLARILRDARKSAGITQEEAADCLDRTTATLYKIENGLPGVRLRPKVELRLLCELYEITDPETIETLSVLANATKVKGPYQPYRDLVSNECNIYMGLENDAISMFTFEPDVLPGLLQTADYAAEISRLPGSDGRERSDSEVDKRVRLRLVRQGLLTRKPRPLSADIILADTPLRRVVRDKKTMSAQLRHINEVSTLANVSVRVVPHDAGLHLGVITGQFIVLRFPGDEPPVAYSDGYLGDNYFKEPQEIARYEEAWQDINKHALSVSESKAYIATIAREFDDT